MLTRAFTSSLTRRAMALVMAGAFVATPLAAQDYEPGVPRSAFEIRPYAGAFIPTGTQRDFLKDAVVAGAQLSYSIIPQLAVTGTFGWSPSKDRITAGDQTLDIYQYDVGLEARAPQWYRATSWDFTPFVGLGAGGRTYDYRDLDNVDAKTNVAGYLGVGGELGLGRVGLRLEARDYVSRFEPLTGNGDTKTRNDVMVATGLTVRF